MDSEVLLRYLGCFEEDFPVLEDVAPADKDDGAVRFLLCCSLKGTDIYQRERGISYVPDQEGRRRNPVVVEELIDCGSRWKGTVIERNLGRNRKVCSVQIFLRRNDW